MIITISGKAGSGKSTIAKLLAKELNLKHYSMGDLTRKYAEKKGMSIKELAEYQIDHPEIDKEIDGYQKDLGKKEDNFIIDGRTGYYFIPKAIKIFFDVEDAVAAKRILNDKRTTENAKSPKELIKQIEDRRNAEIKRYKKLYKTNPYDLTNYDFVLDTSKLNIEQVFKKTLNFINKQPKSLYGKI